MAFTARADINVFGANPVGSLPAPGANKAVGPFYLEQVLVTGAFSSESFIKFDLAFWKVLRDIKRCHNRPPLCF